MTFSTLALLALKPLVDVGGSDILGWLVTVVIIAVIITLIVWGVTKVAGPPSLPDPARWIVWLVVIVAVIWFLFSALGIPIP